MLVDSHCHIYKEYYEDITQVLNDAKEKGIDRVLNNGTDTVSNKEVLELLKIYPHMYGAIGIHPENVDNYTDADIEFIEEHLQEERIVAIGEIGLDYHYTKENKDKQIKLFERQLALAEKYQIPVIIHSRDATLDTINCLKKFNVKGVIHSFSGSLETAQIYLKMGYLLGVNGVVTFKNSNIKEVIKKIPLEHLLLETDSPYLTPEPFRGQQNNPGHIKEIAAFLAELKEINFEEVAKVTTNNFQRMFNKKNNKN